MKALSASEKDYIKQKLYDNGRNIFSRFGIRKTTIRQLSKAAGISSGSFYLFYESKEELFFRILTGEIQKTMKKNREIMLAHGNEPQTMIKMVIRNAVKNFEENPILNKLLDREEFEAVNNKFLSRADEMRDILISTAAEWKETGILIDETPEVIAGIVRALIFMTFHKEEIGRDNFEKSIGLLIDFTARGIVSGSA